MAYNKFMKKDGTVLLDLTDTSVTAETLAKDVTAVDKNGNKIIGTIETYDGTGTTTALITDLVITIGTTTYSILPLMTWYEWVNSEYNTAGFTCIADNSKVFLGDSQNYLLDSEGNPVYGNTAITTGSTYTTSYATTILSSDSAKMVDASGVILTLKEN